MGAWGVSSFENDDAIDWLEELVESDNLLILYSAFEMLEDDYIEFPDGCNAVAAAEVVAALSGHARSSLPERAAQWVAASQEKSSPELIKQALDAIERISSEDSELNELWQESDEYDDWLRDLESLKSALETA